MPSRGPPTKASSPHIATVPATLFADESIFPNQTGQISLSAGECYLSLAIRVAAHFQSGYRFCRLHINDNSGLLHALWLAWASIASHERLPCPHILQMHNWLVAAEQKLPHTSWLDGARCISTHISQFACGVSDNVGLLQFTEHAWDSRSFCVSMPFGDSRFCLPILWNGKSGFASSFAGVTISSYPMAAIAYCAHLRSKVKQVSVFTSQSNESLNCSSAAWSLGANVLKVKPPQKVVRTHWLSMVQNAWSTLEPQFMQYYSHHRHRKYERPPNFTERRRQWAAIQRFEKLYMSDEDIAYAWMELLGHGPWTADREINQRYGRFMRLVDFGCLLHDYTNGVTKEWQRKREYLVRLSRGERPASFKHQSRMDTNPTEKRYQSFASAASANTTLVHQTCIRGCRTDKAGDAPEADRGECAQVDHEDSQNFGGRAELSVKELSEWDAACREAACARGEQF